MSSEIRTFKIRDAAIQEDELALAEFLRTVEVSRIETAFADGAWHILVMYEELRKREETAQIQSAIVAALNGWRAQTATSLDLDREAIMSSSAVQEIARYAPTTEIELSVVGSALGIDTTVHGAAIVHVVRQTLEDLTS
ncbi:HRDC domain-containing protein [Skermanella mucosa]|uniref:HRDC domain-containing protein n=1 Tax=Skermanella mucosa TaxID=1789672 RepID=UPI00192C0686|nr:HRDC domain-containing protein [Skermanella mucosa]UEM22624.1 HRDC domain-containing protein [Skermanella mucosa]